MKTRVWIEYEPLVFKEALARLLGQLETVETVESPSRVDVGVFRLANSGKLQDFFKSFPLRHAKLVVFSPEGDHAFIRLPESRRWRDVHPFGVPQLLAEVRAGRGQLAAA